MFAWGGPVIVAIVWACLKAADVIGSLTVNEAVLGILHSGNGLYRCRRFNRSSDREPAESFCGTHSDIDPVYRLSGVLSAERQDSGESDLDVHPDLRGGFCRDLACDLSADKT
ncbi:MAG: hypothetical protein IKH56_01325 [Oscillospiraceae bacterium]|nr:hypothetical protein [Oscillospiraceae bacterium]